MSELGFDGVVSRRTVLLGGAAFGVAAFADAALPPQATAVTMEFEPVTANQEDTITLPDGYTWQVVASWGDPLWSSGNAFDPTSRGTAESQARAFGDNNDGMSCFAVGNHTVLAVNNEYTNAKIIWGNRASERYETEDDVRKGMNAHGVSLVEISRGGRNWQVVKDSPLNRRITPNTPMDITGPGRGHGLLKTRDDPQAVLALGTFNNCGNGRTPWGTYLTCEENFHSYFHSPSNPDWTPPTPALQRYGFRASNDRYGWATVAERFDLALEPNEPNRCGYIVEIDPADPTSRPRKHTAMGRFKHENCEMVVARNQLVVAYMGDDERGEHFYKFVSSKPYRQGMNNPSSLLEEGTLYAARFDEDGTGRWLALTPETTGMDTAEICINTRLAATAVGATTMDRPEWVAANPTAVEAYCCLTNNKNRGKPGQPVNAVNPRANNKYGQIVRWSPAQGNHAAQEFKWDLFVIAGNPTVHQDVNSGSSNVTPDNMFNSPDGLAFDSQGRLWIQTDGNYSNAGDFAGMGNNQMLLADAKTSAIRRFMVGPKECEVTGITWSPDRKTIFVGIQHPGSSNPDTCHFPGGGTSLPRSSVIAIEKDGWLGLDRAVIG